MTADATMRRFRVSGAATLALALLQGAALAGSRGACNAAVNEAAVEAVDRSPWIGQASAVGDPFVLRPGVLRARVGLFGPQSAFFDVDVSVDAGCNVRSTSIRLDSNPWLFR
jgi:hypothetical protein